jgi:hypothetical protein
MFGFLEKDDDVADFGFLGIITNWRSNCGMAGQPRIEFMP